MAQVASGGLWTTTITLVNNGTAPAHAQLNFYDDNGAALALPLAFPQATSTPLMAATLNQTIAAGGGVVIATTGSASQATQVVGATVDRR